MHGDFAQQCNTHLQCINSYRDDGHTHIVAVSMYGDV